MLGQLTPPPLSPVPLGARRGNLGAGGAVQGATQEKVLAAHEQNTKTVKLQRKMNHVGNIGR